MMRVSAWALLTELLEIKEKYGDERKTDIIYAGADFRPEDVIADADVVITIPHLGYIKRTALSEYRLQSRGGKGSKAAETRDEDFLEQLFTATNHNYLLFFTLQGKCYWMRAFEVPEGAKLSGGQTDPDLAGLREPKFLDGLPAAEGRACREMWREIDLQIEREA